MPFGFFYKYAIVKFHIEKRRSDIHLQSVKSLSDVSKKVVQWLLKKQR